MREFSRRRADVYYGELETPLGWLLLTAVDSGLCTLERGSFDERKEQLENSYLRAGVQPDWHCRPDKLSAAGSQLEQYFAGQRQQFDLAIEWIFGTSFQKQVWQALLTIPYGQTATYKQIAEQIGNPKAVRAVGGANNKNPISIIVPCHRVIGANGELVGYGGGLDMKRHLLELERNTALQN